MLRSFPGDDVERALAGVVQNESDEHLRAHALTSLGTIGTARVLPVLDAAANDRDALVAHSARHSADEIRTRDSTRKREHGP
jgi:HEAT repeat protein